MQAMRIAFLEDDPDQADRIVSLLQGAGHVPHLFPRGRALLTNLQSDNYDLIMLDWEVPDLSGYEVLQALRGRLNVRTPVLFLTHRDNETDVVQALEAGADDFLIKPPRERELLARMEALGRRVREPAPAATVLNVPPYRIDLDKRQIHRDNELIELTRREFEVAVVLFQHVGTVVSRGFILDSVWGRGDTTTTRTVDMHVSRVRKLLGLSAAIGLRLAAVYGYGYRLERTGTEPG